MEEVVLGWPRRMRSAACSAAVVAVLAAVTGASALATEEPTPTPSESSTSEPSPTEPSPSDTSPTSTPDPSTSEPDPSTSTPAPTSPTTTTAPPTVFPTPEAPIWRPPRPLPAPDEEPPDHFEPLTGSFLATQIAEADRITAALNASTSKVAVATREMDALATKSNALLESVDAAREAERAATEEVERAQEELAVLETRLEAARAVVREWVFLVYSGGGASSDVAFMIEAMATEAEDVGDPIADLSYLTEERTRALQDVRILTAEQARLGAAAERAKAEAVAATTAITDDSSELQKVLEEQRARVGELRALQIAEVERAGPVATILVGARTPEARAAAARLRDALTAASADVTDIGKPCTDDTTVYPNGMFPSSALCPLWGAPGERLAPGAAASFNALSKAYASQSGVPLCVTDSYRSLAGQIATKATRGRFAATPGTSRHGLGRALDLCGGVQDFSSPAHRWMKQNGPLYGWFHPSWAGAGGSLPEPWHWEYAG
jgi:D-alanyl-D-alanine carboxypeptidase